eukprot:scaffold948_cov106-Cylindrotheca_fusiformis.AAC.14
MEFDDRRSRNHRETMLLLLLIKIERGSRFSKRKVKPPLSPPRPTRRRDGKKKVMDQLPDRINVIDLQYRNEWYPNV